MALMRLQKYLSASGVCSRRKGEQYMTAGRVQVNGEVVTELGRKVDPGKDQVMMDGRPVKLVGQSIYIALHKPVGYVTSCSQPGEKIVLDLLKIPERVVPVGRLDKGSEGLLLLTNDGGLHQRLSHPSFDHEKEYEVTTGQPITDGALQKMAKGLMLKGRQTRPAVIRRLLPNQFRITLKEGRNRQIRRMVQKVGAHVTVLKRVRIDRVLLGRLKPGRWRHLSDAERKHLLREVIK